MNETMTCVLCSVGQLLAVALIVAGFVAPGLPIALRIVLIIAGIGLSTYCFWKSEGSCFICDLLVHWPFW